MGFESSGNYQEPKAEGSRRASAEPESMSTEQLTKYRKGLLWNKDNRPSSKDTFEKELQHVDEILAKREFPTIH